MIKINENRELTKQHLKNEAEEKLAKMNKKIINNKENYEENQKELQKKQIKKGDFNK